MTVEELIAELKQLNKNDIVYVSTASGYFGEVNNVTDESVIESI